MKIFKMLIIRFFGLAVLGGILIGNIFYIRFLYYSCLNAKIPLKVVQKWLGHSKLDTTADIYSHVTEELDRAEAAVLDRYLTQKAAKS